MCGITGRFEFGDLVPDRELIHSMCEKIHHRGPDDEGIFIAPHIGLGQRRLTIIDLAAASCPPLCNEDNSIWLVFNGEIYNFSDLRANLISKGHCFRTNSDTEVIIHLYEEFGEDCLSRLHGMFAFALYDQRLKKLFCARDRFGKKPFCYKNTGRAIVFGSEIKAISACPDILVEPDFGAINRYLTYSYIPSPETAFAGIKRLPPGHFLTCGVDGKEVVKRFWSPPAPAFSHASEAEIREELLAKIRKAVKLRLISDVPLGAFLSGGIDSASIVAMMASEAGQPVKTFSIGFDDGDFNELPYAKMIAERYGTEHHELMVRPDAVEVLPLLVKHYNEPFADPSAIPSYYVAKMTRQFVTVALSGDGGDESFGGYDNYASILAWSWADILPQTIRGFVLEAGRMLVDYFPRNNFLGRAFRAAKMFGSANLKDRKNLFSTTLKQEEKNWVYTRKFRDLAESCKYETGPEVFPYQVGEDALSWLMRHDQNYYLPDCLMVKMDIASMACSLEVRSPFLDHELVEFAATIPSYMKRNAAGGKLILKDAMKGLLPEALLKKPKTGFAIPLASWLSNELAPLLKETLLSEKHFKRGLFEAAMIQKMVEEHISKKRDWSNRLWAFLFLELWFREFID